MRLWCAGDDAAHLGGRREQRRGLAAHHPQIGCLGGREVARRRELQHLALGDGGRGVGEDAQHPQRAGLDHHLERAREEIVADQHR